MKVVINGMDITGYVEQAVWGGDLQQASRTLSVRLEHGCRPELGDKVEFSHEGSVLFRGIVMYVDIGKDTNSIECNDYGIYLANNYTYKEYKGTPQAVAKQVCAEFGVKIGALCARKDKTKITSTGNYSAAKVIELAYEGAEDKPKKQYVLRMDGKKLSVEAAGGKAVADIEQTIETAKRTVSIKNMVNRIIILGDKSKKIGSAEDDHDRKKYGTFQKTYKKEKDKDAKKEAKAKLAGPEKTGSITAIGNTACVAGKAVNVTEKLTGLAGKQIIKSDKHTFTAAAHDMSLEFYYEQ